MACAKPDGSLTVTALAALGILDGAGTAAGTELAKALGKPLFIARSILYRLAGAGLVERTGGFTAAAEAFRITAAGRAVLERGRRAA